MDTKIELRYGNGGSHTYRLIKDIYYPSFDNPILLKGFDSALFSIGKEKVAFTTDTFVVKPIFFRGGDIGKLSVCGTINDLAVCGATPIYLSCGLVIEEGFDIETLKKVIESMAVTAKRAGVSIVTGDTKVVEKGAADGIFINTAGIGYVNNGYAAKKINSGDKIIISGTIAEHGTAIAIDRFNLKVTGYFESDCIPINHITEKIKDYLQYVKIMKDPTRGGIATAINEIAEYSNLGVHLFEDCIPIRREVKSLSEVLGIDPFYLPSEGRILIIVDGGKAEEVLSAMKSEEDCQNASVIGFFTEEFEHNIVMENSFGGKRILGNLEDDMLPRIC